jgi:hypothetical protein
MCTRSISFMTVVLSERSSRWRLLSMHWPHVEGSAPVEDETIQKSLDNIAEAPYLPNPHLNSQWMLMRSSGRARFFEGCYNSFLSCFV